MLTLTKSDTNVLVVNVNFSTVLKNSMHRTYLVSNVIRVAGKYQMFDL